MERSEPRVFGWRPSAFRVLKVAKQQRLSAATAAAIFLACLAPATAAVVFYSLPGLGLQLFRSISPVEASCGLHEIGGDRDSPQAVQEGGVARGREHLASAPLSARAGRTGSRWPKRPEAVGAWDPRMCMLLARPPLFWRWPCAAA